MAASTTFAGNQIALRSDAGLSRRRRCGATSLHIRLSHPLSFSLHSELSRRSAVGAAAAAAAAAASSYFDDGGDGEIERALPSGGGEVGRRLYVGNLPYSMTPSNLAEVFSEAGNVTSVEVVYDRVTDRSRGFAFVTMGTSDEAWSAIRMFDGSLGGRTVKVNFPEVPKGGEREVMGPRIRESGRSFVDSPHKIYAGNLSWIVSSADLKAAFSGCSGVLGAKVIYERETARSRGYGFVSFTSDEDAQSALAAMNGVELEGRPLRLNVAMNSVSGTSSSTSTDEQINTAETADSAAAVSA